jgi:hypothetical protein
MVVNVMALDMAVGVGIAFIIIGALEWLERWESKPKFRRNRRMLHRHSGHS